jgi:toxin-antitoxin system, toxin component, Txe/YoeB family
MIYNVTFSPKARTGLKALKKKEPHAYKKATKLIEELQEHPETGTGHPKPLGDNRVGQWSRRITYKHRLVYIIKNDCVEVLVLSTFGHYDDK